MHRSLIATFLIGRLGCRLPRVLTLALALILMDQSTLDPSVVMAQTAQPVSARAQAPAADSFVVQIVNFQIGHSEPVAKHRIVFDGQVAYDFDELSEENVTVFDADRNRVVVLNRKIKARSIVPTQQLAQLAAELRAQADTPEKKERYGISATVDVDSSTSSPAVLGIDFGGSKYKTTLQDTPNKTAAMQFGQFADWASRLNMARHLGGPSFGRMTLSQAIAAQDRLPLELTLEVQRGATKVSYRSVHTVEKKLSDEDRRRIDEVSGMIALYTDLPLKEFP